MFETFAVGLLIWTLVLRLNGCSGPESTSALERSSVLSATIWGRLCNYAAMTLGDANVGHRWRPHNRLDAYPPNEEGIDLDCPPLQLVIRAGPLHLAWLN
jgi:hypothetical protein